MVRHVRRLERATGECAGKGQRRGIAMPSQIADYAHDAWRRCWSIMPRSVALPEELAARLSPEDQCVQSMPNASPAEMAPRPYHVVFRGLHPGAFRRGL